MSLVLTAIAFGLIGSSVFLSVFYLSIHRNTEEETYSMLDSYPPISILMPAYNEENVAEKTIERVLDLDYPNYQVNFVDDGSTDSTLEIAKKYNDSSNFNLIEQPENKGKAAALNRGIKETDGDYAVVLDADSIVTGDVLKEAAAKMESRDDYGGIICSIMPLNRNTFIRRLQVVEYRLTNFYRSLMSRIGTLDVTPGAFSMYRTSDLRNVGGFDEGNITEDLEMAWSLRKSGKDLGMVYQKRSNTELPANIRGLYDQRVRWARGFIVNAWKHRDMFFKKEYGWFGRFQLPLQAIFPLVTVIGLLMVLSGVGQSLYNGLITLTSVGFVLPTMEFNLMRVLLGIDLKVYLPLGTSLVVVAVIMKQAYEKSGENVKHPVALTIYFFAYFIAKSFFWATAILKEMFRTKRIWT